MKKFMSECCGAEIYDNAIQAEVAKSDGTIDIDVICVPICSKCHKSCKVKEAKK